MAAASDFNRQFIMIRFKDLDSPSFVRFLLSPAFPTYLFMRRYIWRSDKTHYMGLDELYTRGLLACSLERAKLAECLGGFNVRKISTDIEIMNELGVVKILRTGRQSVYVLGEWGETNGARYEVFYLDSLCVAEDIPSVDNSQSRNEQLVTPDVIETSRQIGAERNAIIEKRIKKE